MNYQIKIINLINKKRTQNIIDFYINKNSDNIDIIDKENGHIISIINKFSNSKSDYKNLKKSIKLNQKEMKKLDKRLSRKR